MPTKMLAGRARLRLDPDGAEPAARHVEVRGAAVEVDVLRGHREAGGAVRLRRAHQVARVVTQDAVADLEREPAGQQAQRRHRHHRADHDRDHPAGTPARAGQRRRGHATTARSLRRRRGTRRRRRGPGGPGRIGRSGRAGPRAAGPAGCRGRAPRCPGRCRPCRGGTAGRRRSSARRTPRPAAPSGSARGRGRRCSAGSCR